MFRLMATIKVILQDEFANADPDYIVYAPTKQGDEIALISHESFFENKSLNPFFGWIFKSSHYINSPHNPSFDIRLHSCLEEDPIFLKKAED